METIKQFGGGHPCDDPYMAFNPEKHFRPTLNKSDLYTLLGYSLGSLLRKPIFEAMKAGKLDLEQAAILSVGQKALHYWYYLDAQVTNGGFVQFYYNGYAPYVPALLSSLEAIGEMNTVALLRAADGIYQANKEKVHDSHKEGLFESDLYDELNELDQLDDAYYKINKTTILFIGEYIKAHPNEFCVDEKGMDFPAGFSGEVKTYYDPETPKEIYTLTNDRINGEFKSFHRNGNLKEQIWYLSGQPTGERVEYFENGNKKYQVQKLSLLGRFANHWYYENGHPQKLEHKSFFQDSMIGDYREWYDNGQLALSVSYNSTSLREGKLLEFYPDGKPKEESEYADGKCRLQNYWSKDGVRTLKDGTGLKASGSLGPESYYTEKNYRNYLRHGQQKTYMNGMLSLYQEMKDGLNHGITRRFYRNGKLQDEIIYKLGEVVSNKWFPKSKKPEGLITFRYLMKDEWLIKDNLPVADKYPVCINEEEIRRNMNFPELLYEPQYQDTEGSTCLWLSVDEDGNVTHVKFTSAYMTRGDEFTEVAHKMRFSPAINEGKNVASWIYIIANFNIG